MTGNPQTGQEGIRFLPIHCERTTGGIKKVLFPGSESRIQDTADLNLPFIITLQIFAMRHGYDRQKSDHCDCTNHPP